LFRLIAPRNNAGFTLIEALVALSIVAIALSSIGALIATTARGARSIDEHLTRLETARTVIAALPERHQLATGTLAGQIANHSWRVDVLPFALQGLSQPSGARWIPQAVTVTVWTPSGAAMKINTIRLQQRNSK
jgi:general secretion pathway protein I